MAQSSPEATRRYERIDIELPVRLFIPSVANKKGGGGDGLTFEAFAKTKNLSLGGIFLKSTFLMKEEVELMVELGLPSGPLPIRAKVAHTVELEARDHEPGLGIEFLDVDAH